MPEYKRPRKPAADHPWITPRDGEKKPVVKRSPPRTEKATVKLTVDEHQAFRAWALRFHLTVSEFMRRNFPAKFFSQPED